MDLFGWFLLILASLTQIHYTVAQGCSIISINSPSASSLNVKWKKVASTTNYMVDIRELNVTILPPVVVSVPPTSTEKLVQGLKPGSFYNVMIKAFYFYSVLCSDTKIALTVPPASQIILAKAISSTAITFEWSAAKSANRYFIILENTGAAMKTNTTFTHLSGVVENLQAFTAYNCYVYSSNTAGLGARSDVKSVTTLIQPPVNVTVHSTGSSTARVSWQKVSKVLTYQVTVTEVDNSKQVFVTNTINNYVDVAALLPCSMYKIGVSSLNAFLEPGEPAYTTYKINFVTPVTFILADYSCSRNTVTVTWGLVFGAKMYRAMVAGSTGAVQSCTSQTGTCEVADLGCGQRYQVHVKAISGTCESTSSSSTYFETVPCAPTGLMTFRECFSNVILLTWTSSNNTSYYVATSSDSAGTVKECMVTDASCSFSDIDCGQMYQFTVYSVTGQCNSDLSMPVSVQSAPCGPTNLRAAPMCDQDALMVTWDTAPGAHFYTVEALGNLGNYNCSSTNTSCILTDMQCGQSLSMWISAWDNECISSPVLGEVAQTMPCTPENISAKSECSPSSVTLEWDYSAGAAFYVASVMHADGSVHRCNSSGTSCQVQGLRCGETYSASLVANTVTCSSALSPQTSVDTGPCPPSNVKASLDCTTNHALVSWSDLRNGSRTVTMENQHGGLLNCSTSGSNCSIPDLQCGQTYTITVTYHDSRCSSVPSQAIQLHSVPCRPKNVQAAVNCTTGVLSVGWNVTALRDSYMTAMLGGEGGPVYCNSTGPHCSVSSLECGRSYNVMTWSVYGTCLSKPSNTVTMQQVPCTPTNVTAVPHCQGGVVTISWAASRGATSYTAVAVGSNGHRSACSSSSTTCNVAGLRCSQVYTVGVMALDDNCTSPLSQTVTVFTVPCAPMDVGGWINCVSNAASISWNASPNAVAYTAQVVGQDGHSVSCNSSAPLCQTSSLQCGQMYTVTVSASDGSCQSTDSMPVQLETAPCAPLNVHKYLHCKTNALTITWDLNSGPLNFSATARAANGTEHTCRSWNSSCEVSGLSCGQVYAVTVTAANRICSSPASVTQTIETAPCVPQNVRVHTECGSNTLVTSWDSTFGAKVYTATVFGQDSYVKSCSTSNLSCSFSYLRCGQQYNISVLSMGSNCSSTQSPVISLDSVPCDPENVTTHLSCNTSTVTVAWNASPGAWQFMVLATAINSQMYYCSTGGGSCQLSGLECGKVYDVVVLAGDRTCNSTLRTSATVATAPCPPVIVNSEVDCASNVATLAWVADTDVVDVIIGASSSQGHRTWCHSVTGTCNLTDLQCGQTYIVHATAVGLLCDSPASPAYDVITAPCAPMMVTSEYDCTANTATVSWAVQADGFILAQIEASGLVHSCITDQTTCSFSGLLCGQDYNITTQALAGHCNSSSSWGPSIQTVPCAPENVSVSLVCSNDTALVKWAASPRTFAFDVITSRGDGIEGRCHTHETSCALKDMRCGETYNISVTPYSYTCPGLTSTSVTYIAGPCAPANVTVALECGGNVGSVSWAPVPGAEAYLVTAMGHDGYEHMCYSNVTGCSFIELHCGETYSVTVVTIERGCYSRPSPNVTLISAICPPRNLQGAISCDTNVLSLTWDQSPGDQVTYFISSQKQGGPNTTYSTADTSYRTADLQCGEQYVFSVFAQDASCNSSLATPLDMHTIPCPPTDLEVMVECAVSKATLSWAPSASAQTYTASINGEHGQTSTCTTNGTSCLMYVDCGQHYQATVMSSTDTCNSSLGSVISFDSAPCLPENVVAELHCSTNSVTVHWKEMAGSVSYTALALGTNGSHASCNTVGSNCTIPDLQCGQVYGVAVISSVVNCSTIRKSDHQVQAAPCKPHDPRVELDCSTNDATVSWETSGEVQGYTAMVVGPSGERSTCNSSGSDCTFPQLSCGETYVFSVAGVTDQCRSEASTTMALHTAPCVPTHVQASLDCDTGIVEVTWDSAKGAVRYMVWASGNGGHNVSCSTADTQCHISDTQCGQDYNVTVLAVGTACTTFASEPVMITTGPCPLSNLETLLDCSSNTALLSWNPGNGTISYSASAEPSGTGEDLTCNTSSSACNITSLQCSQTYYISVRGQGYTCPSPAVSPVVLSSAPCPPTQLSVTASCDSDMLAVSWTAVEGAVSYQVSVEGSGGHTAAYDSANMTCLISGLLCGEEYAVSVMALNGDCVGGKSKVYTIRTAPCVVHSVQTSLDCPLGSLSVTWQQSDGVHYYVLAESETGVVLMCDTNSTACTVDELLCGNIYTVTVVASDGVCNSSGNVAQNITAAPCPPISITGAVDCISGDISITWDPTSMGVWYRAMAVTEDGGSVTCGGSNSSCTLSAVQCGTEYSVTVAASRNSCMGPQSAAVTVGTAPCMARLTEVIKDCQSDSAWVMWEESAGTEHYILNVDDELGTVFHCNTSQTSCLAMDLHCGQQYTFQLLVSNDQCLSLPSDTLNSRTGPCVPQQVHADATCSNKTTRIFWAQSDGALSYTATVVQADGHAYHCTTNSTSCDIFSLPCGEMYTVTVVAEGQSCNSSQSNSSFIRTAPCVPQNVTATVDCGSNVATVEWDSSKAAWLYSVEAIGLDGLLHTCFSLEPSCNFTTLHCGERYSVTVTALDGNCSSDTSQAIAVRTVPCTPQDVVAQVDCRSNAVTVFWVESSGAEFYSAVLEDEDGRSAGCQSHGTDCNMSSLSCGSLYRVAVTAVDMQCSSPQTTPTDVHSAPCMPSDIDAVLDCEVGMATLSWNSSAGAVSYTATGTSTSGRSVTCNSSSAGCVLAGLQCGEEYAVEVLSQGLNCSTIAHMAGRLLTAPCPPHNVEAMVHCGSGVLHVSWDSNLEADSFHVEAAFSKGVKFSCITSDVQCSLPDLPCGHNYTVTVTAERGGCQGAPSEPVHVSSVPCMPQGVMGNLECVTNTVWVSWDPAPGVQAYMVTVRDASGDNSSCSTSDSSCAVSDLLCGTRYTVHVISYDAYCDSPPSNTTDIQTAPCQPENVSAELYCSTGSALVTWDSAEGTVGYLACAQAGDSEPLCCNAANLSCTVEGLQCGATYNFSVQASDGACNTSSSQPLLKGAAPCPPTRVETRLLPMQQARQGLRVFWSAVNCPGVEYLVETNGSIQGDRKALFQLSSYWTEYMFFEILLPCSSLYMVTVRSRNVAGAGPPSEAITGITAPCPPSAITYSISNGSATLSWNASAFASEYTVHELHGLNKIEVCRTTELHCTVTSANRSPVEVMASNAAGHSNPSRDIKETILDRNKRDLYEAEMFSYLNESDLPIPEVHVGRVTGNSVHVDWIPVGGDTYYSLIVQEQSTTGPFKPTMLHVYSFSSVVTGLKPATRYCISVSAKNPFSSSPYSEPVCINTSADI